MNTKESGRSALRTPTIIALLSVLSGAAMQAEAQVRPSIAGLQTRIATLETQVAAGIVPNLAGYVAMDLSVPSSPTLRVAGANVQVVNGLGSTSTTNGLGNIVVGYNEVRPETDAAECSRGEFDESFCSVIGGIYSVNHRSGSHNLVVGSQQNYSNHAGMVAGDPGAAAGSMDGVIRCG